MTEDQDYELKLTIISGCVKTLQNVYDKGGSEIKQAVGYDWHRAGRIFAKKSTSNVNVNVNVKS